VNNRRVVILRPRRVPLASGCKVLFVGRSQKKTDKNLANVGRGVLTVGEGESFVRERGVITFVIEGRRIRFDINLPVVESAGFKLSSKLLSVARSLER
jgi:YfiR/HmsC-like